MMRHPFEFASITSPIQADKFFDEYWEKKPLFVQRRNEDYYASLISQRDIEHIISCTDVRYPALRLAKNGVYLPPASYTKNVHYGDDSFTGVADISRISAEYRSGATVVLPALHRCWQPLAALCADLETRFDHVIHTNAYLTPGNAAGFAAHYDAHDVFILQITGKKHWRIYEPPFPLPHESQPFSPHHYKLPAPLSEMELTPGDVLYLPRGYIHDAATSGMHSIHITLGISVYTWVELALELLSSCKEVIGFRRALPTGFASREDLKDAMTETFRQLLEELVRSTNLSDIIESFVRRVRMGRVPSAAYFTPEVSVLGLTTMLQPPESSRYRVADENGSVVLYFDGKRLVLPQYVRSTLDVVCSRSSFTASQLPSHLDDETKLVLLRYLHGEGFLEPVNT